jgi:transcriptional regulator GlxA family with amidase domain
MRHVFKTVRVSPARELLEFSRKSVDNVALSVGYEEVGGYRRIFHKIVAFRLSPSVFSARQGGTIDRSC